MLSDIALLAFDSGSVCRSCQSLWSAAHRAQCPEGSASAIEICEGLNAYSHVAAT